MKAATLKPCCGPVVGYACTALIPPGTFFCEDCWRLWGCWRRWRVAMQLPLLEVAA